MALKRIFWLGMHKILVQTELPRLRLLGYEVFNPPYLSSVKDQSACVDWDSEQATTLPPHVFAKLANYNFFYNSISSGIADILNTYFDAIIVTISPGWLADILEVYKGKIIYRVYGQTFSLSQELIFHGLLDDIIDRDNFYFVPHALEAVSREESWLHEREVIVPYCLPKDIFEHVGSWGLAFPKKPEIVLTCPNIANAHFEKHYQFLKANFADECYRYYGVQLTEIRDHNVVGTLERSELITRFIHSAGYLYTHTEENVCYLPPLEMMVLGGPVLYLQGSLLDRYFDDKAPGRCFSIQDARAKAERLIQGDQAFIREIIASQNEIVARYSPDNVWPIFDSVFLTILEGENKAPHWLLREQKLLEKIPRKRVYIFHHFREDSVRFREGIYKAVDERSRLARQVAVILASSSTVEVVLTVYSSQKTIANGYFRETKDKDRIRVFCIDSGSTAFDEIDSIRMKKRIRTRFIRMAKCLIHPKYRQPLKGWYIKIMRVFDRTHILPTRHVDLINRDENCMAVFIPNFHLFPEALQLKKKVVLYLSNHTETELSFLKEKAHFAGLKCLNMNALELESRDTQNVFCQEVWGLVD